MRGTPSFRRATSRSFALMLGLLLVALPGIARADFSAVEGQPFSGKVVDVGAQCALTGEPTIYWGDGTPTSAGASDGGTGVTGSHTYADERSTANGNVSYSCAGDPAVHSADFTATVADAPLTATGRDVSGNLGQAVGGVVAHFSDGNPQAPASDFQARIDWGDGITTAGVVTGAPGGGFNVSAKHPYQAAGNYTVATSVTDVGGSTAAASSTARVTPPPGARLTVTPDPTCTDVPTDLDARASTAAAPIVEYRFEYTQRQASDPGINGEFVPDKMVTVVIADGPRPVVGTSFDFNRSIAGFPDPNMISIFGGADPRVWIRDPVDVKVTTTDSEGATSTATAPVDFTQYASTESRQGCPPSFVRRQFKFPFTTLPGATVDAHAATVVLPCRGRRACIGATGLVLASPARAAAVMRRRRPVLIALANYRIAAGRRGRIHARLTKRGRQLLQPGHSVRVHMFVSAVGPTGRALVRSRFLRLRRPRRR